VSNISKYIFSVNYLAYLNWFEFHYMHNIGVIVIS